MRPDVRIEQATSDHVLAHWDRVVLVIWRGRTTHAGVRRAEKLCEEHARRCDGPVLLLTVVDPLAKLPGLDVRLQIVGSLKRAAGRVERSALVFEGEGFRAASVRAVVAGLLLFARPRFPHRIFSSVGEAARFLVGAERGAPARQLLIRAEREARQQRELTEDVLPG